jgi:hypothetical protein
MNAAEFGPKTLLSARKDRFSGLSSNIDIASSPSYLSFGLASRSVFGRLRTFPAR